MAIMVRKVFNNLLQDKPIVNLLTMDREQYRQCNHQVIIGQSMSTVITIYCVGRAYLTLQYWCYLTINSIHLPVISEFY